ncbi:MAG: hypothetical protein JXR96_10415 [Deltaproteobacteria bacterium]|nr:hypothetical protein [Deltaproteobacteria bacterium]
MRALSAVAVLALALPGCVSVPGLDRSRITAGSRWEGAEVDDVPVRGHEVCVELKHSAKHINGELMAVDMHFVWLLEADGCLQRFERSELQWVSVEFFFSYSGVLGLWTGLGSISAISHGWFAVLSLPTWLGSGLASAITPAVLNDLEFRPRDFDKLLQFARFPQGLPRSWMPPRVDREECCNFFERQAPMTGASVVVTSDWPSGGWAPELAASGAEPPAKPAVPAAPGPEPKAIPDEQPGASGLPGEPAAGPGEGPILELEAESAGSPGRPAWVDAGSGAGRVRERRVLLAVGKAKGPDAAREAGRRAMLRIVEMICLVVTEACSTDRVHRKGVEVIATWRDPASGELFALAVLPMEISGLSEAEARRVFERWERK